MLRAMCCGILISRTSSTPVSLPKKTTSMPWSRTPACWSSGANGVPAQIALPIPPQKNGSPLLPEHFPTASGLHTSANPKEQLAAAVLHWLHERIGAAGTPADLYAELLRAIEPPLLEELMRKLQGNRVVAAQWLGLNRATVRKKLTEYGLADVHRPGQKPADDEDTEE